MPSRGRDQEDQQQVAHFDRFTAGLKSMVHLRKLVLVYDVAPWLNLISDSKGGDMFPKLRELQLHSQLHKDIDDVDEHLSHL